MLGRSARKQPVALAIRPAKSHDFGGRPVANRDREL
jgi:hypothetical protein